MKAENGQALVLVLLSLAVVLTLVLYILSRSVTDVAISSKTSESIKAFSAAEAGVEQALVVGSGSTSTSIGSASFTSNVSGFAEGVQNFAYPLSLYSEDSMTVWFVAHNPSDDSTICNSSNHCFTGNTLQVCWGSSGTSANSGATPAIELSVFYETTPGDPSTTQIARGAYDPNSSRIQANSFSAPGGGSCSVAGVNYQFQKTIQMSDLGVPAGSNGSENGLQFARVRMFYNFDAAQPVGINVNFAGNSTLPSQGQDIVSTGTSGQSNRRVDVFQGWPEVPDIFMNAVYSGVGVSK